jgi:fructose-1,6-bisphosphatase I
MGDVHRTLMRGEVFGYPGDARTPTASCVSWTKGADVLYRKQAGGLSTTGTKRVMDVSPKVVHQRVPAILGSKNDVQEVIDAYDAAE